jgi:hypothetical protein
MDQLLKLKCQAKTVEEFLSHDNLTACLKVRAAFHISQVMASIRELGVEQKVWMNELISIDLEKMIRAHLIFLMYQSSGQIID